MGGSTVREQLQAVVENAATLWNGGQEVIRLLSTEAGRDAAAPAAALEQISDADLAGIFASDAAQAELTTAREALAGYLNAETWFDRCSRTDARLETLRRAPVAYFCAEFGIATWLPIYSGGLGVLAGDMLKEASDMGVPFVGVGLFYKHGFFHQKLDESRYQTQVYDTLDPEALGLARVLDAVGRALRVEVPIADRVVHAAVWTLRVGRVSLYLLDTDVAENLSADDRSITGGLYAGGPETRIQQELVLGIGGVRLLRSLGITPSIYSMNEGHAAFLGVELLAQHLRTLSFDAALKSVRSSVVYTNHTVVPAGNDVFPQALVEAQVGPYADAGSIGIRRLLQLAAPGPDSGFSMAVLAFQTSGKANAVSRLHAEVIPREWPGFPVEAVTNGVHVPTWLGADVQAVLERYGVEWRSDSPRWDMIRSIPDVELAKARDAQRSAMIRRVNETCHASLDPNALTLVWARRFAEYKRAFLLASDKARLVRLLTDHSRPVQIIIAGKAHPADETGKWILRELLQTLECDPTVGARVVFVEDYNLDIGQWLAAGADVWLNTPRKPFEASGTSGMKSSDNGGIQLTVTDGWAAEVDWWGVGWGIAGIDDLSDREQMFGYLETGIVPMFYDRDGDGVSAQWTSLIKNTMITTLSRYSARRMLTDYLYKLYLPLLETQHEMSAVTAT